MNQSAIVINAPVNPQYIQFELSRAELLARYQAKIAALRRIARRNHRIERCIHGVPDYWLERTDIDRLMRQYDRDILALYLLYRDVLRDASC